MTPNNNFDKEQRKSHFVELTAHMPFSDKIIYSKNKIEEFLNWCKENEYKEVSISFSGGKDSTVLFDLLIKVHKSIKSKIYIIPVYAMEITFPSTLKFIRDIIISHQAKNKYIKDLELFAPKLPWNKILHEKGFPIFSKQISVILNRLKRTNSKTGLSRWAFAMSQSSRFVVSKYRLFLLDERFIQKWNEIDGLNFNHFFSEKCCDFVKGKLKHDIRPSFVGTLALESEFRKRSWINGGCNILNKTKPLSRPLSIWTENDVWKYIKVNKLAINKAYNFDHNISIDEQKLHFKRLGCTSCPFGSHIEELKYKRSVYFKSNLKDDIENNSTDKFVKFNEIILTNYELPKEQELWNRYEFLKEYYPSIYQGQIHSTRIYRILIDMNITIKNDPHYMEMYKKRRLQINEWYDDIFYNFLNILMQIESHSNKKEVEYTVEEINRALEHFKIDEKIDSKFLKDYRKNYTKK
ncbi:MAG: phosphoadenosine phosphosulfate reductase family protein [Malacoplasma sp.]